MLFSILIAHYQNWIFFQDCYQSIVNQTYQNFEIIIVDDCSQDDSYEKLVELSEKDARIKLHRNIENKGVGFTKNKCLQLANGDVCGFLDPDDALLFSALQDTLDIFKNNQSIDVVYGMMVMCDNHLTQIEIFKRAKKILNHDPYFVNINTSVAHFFTFRKKALEKIGGIDPSLKSAVDQDLYLKLYEIGEFKFLNKPLYLYRLHEKGVSQESNKHNAKTDFKRVIRNAMERRNVKKISGVEIANLSNDELYELLAKRENSFCIKIKKRLKQLI